MSFPMEMTKKKKKKNLHDLMIGKTSLHLMNSICIKTKQIKK